MRIALRTTLALTIIVGVPSPVTAQEPQLRPLMEHLQSATPDDLGAMRYIFRRCAALEALVGRLSAERGQQELAAQSERRGTMFLTAAVELEKRMGTSDEAVAASVTTAAIERIGEIIAERMNSNMALTGSYFADDPLLGSDVQACVSLAEPPS